MKRNIFLPLLVSILLLSLGVRIAFAVAEKPLSANNAFHLTLVPTKTDSVLAQWTIAPGYYLYKDRFKIRIRSPQGAKVGFLSLPKGIEKNNTILGKHFVYKDRVSIAIPLMNPTKKPLSFIIKYQGCAEWGFCYSPQTKLVTIKNSNAPKADDISIIDYQATLSTTAPQSLQREATKILQEQSFAFSWILFFGFGLLLAFTPCVLPMIPILSGIIVGHEKNITTRKAFCLSLAYVIGMSISFAAAGLVVGFLGSNVQAAMQQPWVLILFSVFFILLSLSLFGFYELRLPTRWQQKIAGLSKKQQVGHYFSAAIMGALSTLIVSPCVSAPLVGALAYIGNTGSAVLGGTALFFMGLGMGAPLLIIGASFGKILPKIGRWMNTVELFFGFVMLGVAILLLQRIIPGSLSLFLWACLLIVSSIYLGGLSKRSESGWGKLWQGFGVILLTYGVLLIIGSAMGNSNFFKPLEGFFIPENSKPILSHKLDFKSVKSISDIEQEIGRAKKEGQPVMLDFYASWCVACNELDRNLFSESKVQSALTDYRLLRADLTKNDAVDKALKVHFGVLGPPTIIFFNKKGEQIKRARIIGEINVTDFLQHIKLITNRF